MIRIHPENVPTDTGDAVPDDASRPANGLRPLADPEPVEARSSLRGILAKTDPRLLVLAAGAAATVLYSVSHSAASGFLDPFGVEPEMVGLTQQRLITDFATILVSIAVFLAGLVGAGVIEYRFTKAVRPSPTGDLASATSDRRSVRSFVGQTLLILGPLTILSLLAEPPWSGSVSAVVFLGALVVTVGTWGAAASVRQARARVKGFASSSLLFAGAVAFVRFTAPPGVDRGLVVLVLLFAFALRFVIHADSSSPAWKATRGFLLSLFPLLGLSLAVAATSGVLHGWLTVVLEFAFLGWAAAYLSGPPLDRDEVARVFPNGRPRIGGWSLATGVSSAALLLVFSLWTWAAEEGQTFYDEGKIPGGEIGLIGIHPTPAQVIPKGNDPLHVCDGSRGAILLGRADGVAHVFMVPIADQPTAAPKQRLPLPDDDYAVITGVPRPMPCTGGA